MQLIPIEKVFSNRDSVRKAREAFLIAKGRTLLSHMALIFAKNFTSLFPFIFIYLFLFFLSLYIILAYFIISFPLSFYTLMPRCKFLIAPEEGWFGQLKYSTFFRKRYSTLGVSVPAFIITC